jgi:cell division protein FtsZ
MESLDLNALAIIAAVVGALALSAWFVFRGQRSARGRTIRVVGVGGAGANALDTMKRARMAGVEFVAVNTDLAALNRSSAPRKISIGRSTTYGLGAGGDVAAGSAAAREAAEAIGQALSGSDLVVIVAGLGGGTGSGAAPVVAEIARGQGAMTVAVVTKPFAFEGFRKARVAQDAEAALLGLVDAVATVPNDQVRAVMSQQVTVDEAFQAINEALHRNVAEIVGLVAVPGRISLDLADVRAVLRGGGAAAIGFGRRGGENRAAEAAREALAAPMLASRIKGTTSVLINVSGSRKLRLAELDSVAETVFAASGRDTNLIFGVSLVPKLRDEVQVTVIATGPASPQPDAAAFVPSGAEEPTDARTDETDTAEAPPAFEEDPEGWRPVWLRRRGAPPTTPAPESTSVQRSEAAGTRRRTRRQRKRQLDIGREEG